jgi:mannose-6-phosphate isomerase-like protein (cupin superfamily)
VACSRPIEREETVVTFAGVVYERGSVRLEVLRSAAETDGELHEMRATYGPGSPLPPAHLHPDQDERFEVLEGVLTFVVEGIETSVAAGEDLEVPRGAVHQVSNTGEVDAVAIWQTRPALRTGEFHDDLQAALDAPAPDAVVAVLRAYRDVLVLVPDPFAS